MPTAEPPSGSCDEFVCPDCHRHIFSTPRRDPPPTVCAVCLWMREFVPDEMERKAMRKRLAR
jgi:hypothetical protein